MTFKRYRRESMHIHARTHAFTHTRTCTDTRAQIQTLNYRNKRIYNQRHVHRHRHREKRRYKRRRKRRSKYGHDQGAGRRAHEYTDTRVYGHTGIQAHGNTVNTHLHVNTRTQTHGHILIHFSYHYCKVLTTSYKVIWHAQKGFLKRKNSGFSRNRVSQRKLRISQENLGFLK